MLRTTGWAALGTALPGCASGRGAPVARVEPARRLVPVRVSEDRVIRTVVGLRPFRPSGFRVEVEKLGDKTVVHNYGHGGGGITLSWGNSALAVGERGKGGENAPAAPGCGAGGLATGPPLRRRGAEVAIYAKDLPPHTTSNIA